MALTAFESLPTNFRFGSQLAVLGIKHEALEDNKTG